MSDIFLVIIKQGILMNNEKLRNVRNIRRWKIYFLFAAEGNLRQFITNSFCRQSITYISFNLHFTLFSEQIINIDSDFQNIFFCFPCTHSSQNPSNFLNGCYNNTFAILIIILSITRVFSIISCPTILLICKTI